jgi:hypothetical protein
MIEIDMDNRILPVLLSIHLMVVAVLSGSPCRSLLSGVTFSQEKLAVETVEQTESPETKNCALSPEPAICVETLLDDADAHYDMSAARAAIPMVQKLFEKNSHAFNYCMARVYEILSRSTDAVTGSRTRANERLAITSLEYVEKALNVNGQHADSHRIYSEMLGRRIYGVSTGIKYDAISRKALDTALTLDSKNRRARLRRAVIYLQRPGKYGGNPELALRLLQQLNREAPRNTRVIYFIAEYYRRIGNQSLYRKYLQLAVDINPCELPTVSALDEQKLQQRELRIVSIGVRNPTRTSARRLQRRIASFDGKVFTREVKTQIETALESIPPVDGVSFYYTETAEGLQIDLQIDEDNMTIVNVAVGLNISLDSNGDINWFFGEAPSALFGLLYVETNNFFGTGDTFRLASAAVYNDLRYQHYSRGPDSRFRFAFNVFPLEKYWYHNGVRTGPEAYRYMWTQAEAGLGKSFDMADLFLMQAVKKEFYVKKYDYFKVPDEWITASTFLEASVSSMAYHDTFWLMDGFKLEVKPELIFKPGYSGWGYEGRQTNHNDAPMFKLVGRLGFYKSLLKAIQLRGDVFYLYAANPYLLELTPVGKDSVIDPFSMKLRGFYQEEFVTSHGLVTNALVSFPLFTQKIRMGLFYDGAAFFETPFQKKTQYKHGTGVQMLFKLPWNIDFVAQGALGLNAKRSHGPGIEMDFCLSRLFVR